MIQLLARPVVTLVIIACSTLALAADPADTHPDLHLIPWPKSLQKGEGDLAISTESRIVAADEQLRPLADVLSDDIARLTGVKLAVGSGTGRPGDIVLKIDNAIAAREPILVLRNRKPVRTTDGAHHITIGEQAVVAGFNYRATAEGTTTILQLLGKSGRELRLPKLTIHDWPHADYCGVMLDVARQDHPIEAIRKVVQLCRLYKARYLQLHLTDDQGWTFPSTRYAQLGSKNYGAHGGVAPRVYDLAELKALVAYADVRGVTLVPEMEVPGHSGAASRSLPEIFDAINPESRQPVQLGCMNMSNEEIYPALDTIIGEMCDVFRSSPFFHIGSDEVTYGRLSLHPGYKAFMEKHRLKDENELAAHFVAEVCAIVARHGKKAIKWEGLANTATEDVIIMAWELNSTVATEMLARGYTTITCPWTLAVPWEEWNMYVCNGSRLKKGDSVLGATLVAWEQPPLTHITNLRQLPSRQERTWGPDNSVTTQGFAARFQPLDAVAGRLIEMPPVPKWEATLSTSLETSDFLDPVFAVDGNDETFYKSAAAPGSGDHFTLTFEKPRLVHAIEALTGVNRRGRCDGAEIQISDDGDRYTTIATLDSGMARAVLKDNRVESIRLRMPTAQSESLVLRAINLQLMVEVAGKVTNPGAAVGSGNLAVLKGDTEFAYPIGTCDTPVINRDFTLKINNGGNPCSYRGPISGSGRIEIYAGGENAPLLLEGKESNSFRGIWSINSGKVVLAKEAGAKALGSVIVVGGSKTRSTLLWQANDQVQDDASVQLLSADGGNAALNVNGFSDTIGRLTLAPGARVLTDGPQGYGVLTVGEMTVGDTKLLKGVYTASSGWLRGSGYVVVGDVRHVEVSGNVDDPNSVVGAGNIALLKGAAAFKVPDGECAVNAALGNSPLTLVASGKNAHFSGFIKGSGPVTIEAPQGQVFDFVGSQSNSYKGTTTFKRGILRLGRSPGAVAIPGDLTLGGSVAENEGGTVVWGADGQIAPTAVVTLEGTRTSTIDLDGHAVVVGKVVLSKAARIRAGGGGSLRVKQLFVDGRRLSDGDYPAPQPWMTGMGSVTVDARVNVQGVIGAPERDIGTGNIGNLTGNTTIAYPSSGGDYDITTNGFTLALDSGNGNGFAFSGCISGTGNVEFFMGPSATGFRDAPMLLSGTKPNTTSGRFLVKKGRVQLEKPEGVAAISGDVIIGGQGFNDCLFWKNSHQLKDSVNITLLDAGDNGAAYLQLNGCHETAASLTMTAKNRVLTDGPDGSQGELIVKALTVGGASKPAGIYSAASEKWIEGKGKVIVRP
jgi:hexosaminidase